MKRKFFIFTIICCLFAAVPMCNAVTTVDFLDGGGVEVFQFEFDAAAGSFVFTLDTPLQALSWINAKFLGGTPGELPFNTSTNPVVFLTTGSTPLASGDVLGSFDVTTSISNFILRDTLGLPIATAFDYNASTDTYTVSNVPIPGSILLLGSGILGLVGLSRRKRS